MKIYVEIETKEDIENLVGFDFHDRVVIGLRDRTAWINGWATTIERFVSGCEDDGSLPPSVFETLKKEVWSKR